MTERRKRLIEVAFPLEEVSEHSRREKNVRHGHISTLHIWWARRPLAACRAFIYASLVDDPVDPAEREDLLKEVADLASWDAVRKPEMVVRPKAKGGSGLTGRVLLERARARILRDNDNKPPRLLDPFAGGGAIPLEALRLGCDVEASDLNPVAVLILKGTVEYPQKYGRPLAEQLQRRPDDCAGVNGEVPAYIRDGGLRQQGTFSPSVAVDDYQKNPLAADVSYWSNWMLEKAREELAQFYPSDPDGSVPVAYLWSRTVPCPNCQAEMPLIRQYWLVRRDKRKVALSPVVRSDALQSGGFGLAASRLSVDFELLEDDAIQGDPGEATMSGGDTVCLICKQASPGRYIRERALAGKLGAKATAVVIDREEAMGKTYRRPSAADSDAQSLARLARTNLEEQEIGGFPSIPDEPIDPKTLGLRVDAYGVDHWRQLFTDRQLISLCTFARLSRLAYGEMLKQGLPKLYADAVHTYLGLLNGKTAVRSSVQSIYHPGRETVENAMGDGTLSLAWDYVESNPIGTGSGSVETSLDFLLRSIRECSEIPRSANVQMRDAAQKVPSNVDIVLTDPPYYNAYDYAGLSDFFYVWLKRSLTHESNPSLLSLPLTPKSNQAIMASENDRDKGSRAFYVERMGMAFAAAAERCKSGLVDVVFAHTDPDAWATLFEALLGFGLATQASWPIDTELQTGSTKAGKAKLKTSVWLACLPQDQTAGPAFLGDLQAELRREIEDRLLDFWSRGIRGADFFISAIGPALSVYGRHTRVEKPDGSEVTVREFLDIVRRESTRVALQQVLHGEDIGTIDPETRAYLTWAWSYGKAPLDAGEAIALCLATGADYDAITAPHSIAESAKEKSKKVVRLRAISARALNDGDRFGLSHGAHATPLIEELQFAAWLWGANRAGDLAQYRASLGESRWQSLRILGQAVAECLPDGDEDRRLVNGMLGSNAASGGAPEVVPKSRQELLL